MQKRSELPEPSAAALVHSAEVAAVIRERIRAAGGWIDFAEYMDLALYAPALGYYSAGAAKLGAAGDFVTAPEISPLFARCLARACAPLLARGHGGVILELGAGTGRLAADMLAALAARDTLPERYLILETSADMRERQRATLAQLAPGQHERVQWLDRLPQTPVRGVVLANEVADALPVSRFRVRGGRIEACGVAAPDGRLGWAEQPADPALAAAVAAIAGSGGWPDGYAGEVCLRLPAWIHAVAAALAHGVFLLCDYGGSCREVYHPERRDGTLVCHYRHRAHSDPFLYPGLQDITAWVNFSAVAAAAAEAGLEVAGYATQAHFLLDAGLAEELAALPDGLDRLEAAARARTLVLPGEMGEICKVIALDRGGGSSLPGFGFRDLRHLL
jgi:SAM-dependent MidA family methyltransferase